MFRRVRDKLEAMIRSEHAGKGVFLASLAETTFVPIPIEVVLLPAMFGRRRRAVWFATMALAGCLVGATIGYFVGMLAWETVGEWFAGAIGIEERVAEAEERLAAEGFWYILGVALSPVPFQLGYLGAGLIGYSFWLFLLASLVGRGVRYFGLVVLVLVLGRAAGEWLDRHGVEIGIGVTVAFVVVYGGVRLLF